MSKAVFGGLAAVLLVAAVIGVVATVVRTNNKPGETGDGSLSTSSKSVAAFCQPTDYREVCESTLNKVINGSASPKDVIHATFKAAIDEINSAYHLANNVSSRAKDPMNKAALDNCHQLFQDATEELEAAMSETDDVDGAARRIDDIRTWLSAVISYQQTCVDGITEPDLQSTMSDGVSTATKITSNAIAIIDQLGSLFKSFSNAPLKSGRRLLGTGKVYETDAKGLPAWFSAQDRRLLAAQSRGQVKPNVVVAQDGSGDFKTINAALNAMPKKYSGRYVIYVKAGTYKEYVIVTKDKVNVFMYGDGPRKTIVSGNKNFVDGTNTMNTATFAAIGQGFIAKSMGFTNTAGAQKHQAVALRVQSDMSAFFNCRMDGYQDTLYVQTHRQFYRNCVISGTIDFIFGDSSTVIQNSLIIVRRPMDNQQNTVTAHGRSESKETTGLVIQACRIVPDKRLFPDRLKIRSYLGRPWKAYSRTVIMESTIGDLIQPEGWMPWDGSNYLNTLYYAEYANRGAGAGTSGRVNWGGYRVIGKQAAQRFTVDSFIQGAEWVKYTGINYFGGLRY